MRIYQYRGEWSVDEHTTVSGVLASLAPFLSSKSGGRGLEGPRVPEYLLEKARDLHSKGLTVRDIREETGLARSTICRWVTGGSAKYYENHVSKRRKESEAEREKSKGNKTVASAYSHIRIAIQELSRADDQQIRYHVENAMTSLYRAEDSVVLALKVAPKKQAGRAKISKMVIA
jgi:hypothetical protein